jgi:PKD repeat protein
MPVDKISSIDSSYLQGDLSIFPQGLDTYSELYEAKNLARTKLSKDLPFLSDYIFVQDASFFPEEGILRLYLPEKPGLVSEFVYYTKRNNNSFYNLKRGFMSSLDIRRQEPWPEGTIVESGVFAEHHNALKDALINIQTKLGISTSEDEATITGSIKMLENKFFAPIPLFRAYPLKGRLPTQVTFQNFSTSVADRYLWDFGDGDSSEERNPIHIYRREGVFTVQLRIISSSGAQGIATKRNYVSIENTNINPFAYVNPVVGLSVSTAGESNATQFKFVDQSEGSILNRLFQFGDGQTYFAKDPNEHVVVHKYAKPGRYTPSILITFETSTVNKVYFQENTSLEVR